MAAQALAVDGKRRRRRRRRQDRPPVSARLALDDRVKGDIGRVSDELFADLFPHLKNAAEQQQNGGDESPESTQASEVHHVAIAPWMPNATPAQTSWTIVPIVRSQELASATVQFSPSSLALQNFATILQQVAPSKLSGQSRKGGIEILVLDVAVLELDTVFVSLEGDLVKRLQDGEGTFFREHPPAKGKETAAPDTAAGRLADALRVALKTLKVVHNGDLFPLPLPPHPVTHVPPTPGRVTFCEPVAQGILGSRTKIIVTKAHSHSKARPNAVDTPVLNGTAEEDAEDTSNDQFYSAAEDERTKADVATDAMDSITETDTEISEAENEEEISDDSLDDMISLEAPMLPTTTASGISTVQPGSPMTVVRGRVGSGIHTPGSVFSSFTANTARTDRPKGRLFKAQGLMKPVPPELLHPKPNNDDDEEARVYVDIASLNRVGCFSGDWVRLEASEEPPSNGMGLFGLGSLVQPDALEPNWRPARVFGLPEAYSQRRMTKIRSSRHDEGEHRMSFFESQVQRPTTPNVYLSPILLANLEDAPYVRLSPLKRHVSQAKPGQTKIASSCRPPNAQNVELQRIMNPISSERAFDTARFAGIQGYFARRTRVVRTGDIVGIPIDTQLARILQDSSGSGDTSGMDDLLTMINTSARRPDGVAWFRIGNVQRQNPENADNEAEEDVWGGVACIDTSLTRMAQSGAITSLVPGTKDSKWPSYLGLEEVPNASSSPLSYQPSRFVSPLRRRLRELMAAATSKRAIHLKMPPVAILLVSTQRHIGKATAATNACADIGLHIFTIDAYDIVNEGAGGSDVKTEGFLKSRADRALSCGADCCALLIQHLEALTADRMVTAMKEILNDARVLIATTTEVDKVPDGVRGLFTHELEMSAPDEGEREGILRTIIDHHGILLAPEFDLSSVALKTAALVAGDLVDVVERALVARQIRLETLAERTTHSESTVTVRDIQVAGGSFARYLTKADFDVAVDAARKNFADAIGAPKIPDVKWDDVGGLDNVKAAVTETIQLPLERPELFAKGMKKRSGILFYGPPGTGKTLLAKAIATEYSLNFFSVKGPELLNMYIGESEANVRRVFQRARDARPCVVFFDELDSVAPKRGNQGDSGGVMDRIVSQLLAELDGMSGGGDDAGGGVFVIGATNRPDLLDPALLRPGRFDKMLYLGVSDTHEKQLKILEALTRKFTLDPTVSLPSIAAQLPFTYTGADFYALCSDAMLKAVTRQASAVDAKIHIINSDPNTKHAISTANFFDHYATLEDIAVMVTEQDFLDANRELIPSVSAGELMHYERVKAAFEGGQQRNEKRNDGALLSQDAITGEIHDRVILGKGKQKTVVIDRKGKGKAVLGQDEGDDDDADDDEPIIFHDASDKGKGKAVARFEDATASDDEGLY